MIHDFLIRRRFGHLVCVQPRFHRTWVIFLIKNDFEWKRDNFVRDRTAEEEEEKIMETYLKPMKHIKKRENIAFTVNYVDMHGVA